MITFGNNISRVEGVEGVDIVSERAPTPIMISRECGENDPVDYKFADGENRFNSTASLVYYLIGADLSSILEMSNSK